MKTEAYEEWSNLYTDELDTVWNSTKCELKKATMILFVLQREFKEIQDNLEKQRIQFAFEYDAIERQRLLNTSATPTTKTQDQNSLINDQTTMLKSQTPRNIQTVSPKHHENYMKILSESSDDTICCSPKISRQKYFKRKKPKYFQPDDIFSKNLFNAKSYDMKKKIVSNVSDSNTSPSTPKLPSLCTDDLIDCTVIDSTPNATKNSKKGRSLVNCTRKKNKIKKCNNGATLTQMFITSAKSSSDVKENRKSYSVSNGSPNKNTALLENACNVIDDTSQEYIEFKQPKEVICKEQVVRGNNRQKLEGWDCEECKKFYEGLNLNTQEIKNLQNKCSKHRATRQPDDYTPPGYWTLAFTPTQKSVRAESEHQSLTQNSTFFQF